MTRSWVGCGSTAPAGDWCGRTAPYQETERAKIIDRGDPRSVRPVTDPVPRREPDEDGDAAIVAPIDRAAGRPVALAEGRSRGGPRPVAPRLVRPVGGDLRRGVGPGGVIIRRGLGG